MALVDSWEVVSHFSQNGSFAQAIPNYQRREGQVEMAEAVADNLNQQGITVIEGGTGIGKSFAYLVPVLLYLEQNPKKRVVISTATIHLQQQLVEKDIPFVIKTLGVDISYALLKGRGNYLCLSRLAQEAGRGDLLSGLSEGGFQELMEWAQETVDGSYSDLPYTVEPGVWELICSDGALCLGANCPTREKCFYMKAKIHADTSPLVVVNNHLLFADLETKESPESGGGILPAYQHLIFDEAHNMEESAISLFTQVLSKAVLFRSLRRIFDLRDKRKGSLLRSLERTLPNSGVLDDIPELLRDLYDTFQEIESYLMGVVTRYGGSENVVGRASEYGNSITPIQTHGKDNQPSRSSQGRPHDHTNRAPRSYKPKPEETRECPLGDLSTGELEEFFLLCNRFGFIASRVQGIMVRCLIGLPEEMEESRDLLEWRHIADRLGAYRDVAEQFVHFQEMVDSWVAWFQTSRYGVTLYLTPIDVSAMLREQVFLQPGSITAVSATLRVQGSFSYWFRQMGLWEDMEKGLRTFCFESPFLYREQVRLLIPTDTPAPQSKEYIPYLMELLKTMVPQEEGGALILFTSYALLESVYQAAREYGKLGKPLFKQGEMDRFALITRCKEEPSVLFATSSFWEGVDLPGDTLKLLVITKLPFAVPSTPIHRARSEQLTARGEHPFMSYFLPQAILKLRQGFGRLIRKDTDSGTVVLLDPRVVTKSYGRQFLQDLPKCDTRVGEFHQL